MKRFFVCLRFVSTVLDDREDPTLEEDSIRYVIAGDDDEAREKGAALGKAAEHSYSNEAGKEVRWRFQSIVDVQEFCADDICDGVEVYSRMNWRS